MLMHILCFYPSMKEISIILYKIILNEKDQTKESNMYKTEKIKNKINLIKQVVIIIYKK